MANTGPWNYIIVFSNPAGTMEEVKKFLDSREEILTWYICLPNAIFVRSKRSASELTEAFRKFTQDKGRFLILDCNTDRNGWLPPEAWKFMKNEYP